MLTGFTATQLVNARAFVFLYACYLRSRKISLCIRIAEADGKLQCPSWKRNPLPRRASSGGDMLDLFESRALLIELFPRLPDCHWSPSLRRYSAVRPTEQWPVEKEGKRAFYLFTFRGS